MAKRKSRSVASESRLFVLALGLLVGFVIAFVFVLSRMPVDSIISQYNDGQTTDVEIEALNFDYYAVLQAQKAARKPVRQEPVVEPPVVYIEPRAQQLPPVQTPAAPAIAKSPVPQPRVEPLVVPPPRLVQPRVEPLVVQPPRQVQPRVEPLVVQPPRQVQPRIEPPVVQPRTEQAQAAPRQIQPRVQQPQVQTPPLPVRPSPLAPAQRSVPVREIMASDVERDSYYVEAGSYTDNNLAVQVQSALRSLGLEAFIVVRQDERGNFGHRVRIGPFLDQSRLDDTRDRLRASGITPRVIRVKG